MITFILCFISYSYVLPVTFITILLSRTSHHIQRREKAQNEWALYRDQNTEDSLNTELISQKQQQMITHSKDISRRSSQFTRYFQKYNVISSKIQIHIIARTMHGGIEFSDNYLSGSHLAERHQMFLAEQLTMYIYILITIVLTDCKL